VTRPWLAAGSFVDWPVLRVLAPPITYDGAATAHRISFAICLLLVALLLAWMAAVILPFALPESLRLPPPPFILLAAAVVLIPVVRLLSRAHGVKRLPRNGPAASRRPSSWLLLPVLLLLLLSLGAFVAYLVDIARQGNRPEIFNLTLARIVGGGIVSPAPPILCLFAGIYAGMFAAMRRASLVGNGYAWLERTSTAFALFNGRGTGGGRGEVMGKRRASLGDVLDMPAQNLPLPHVLVILLAVVFVALSIGNVSTIDGMAFTVFLSAASATVLMLGLVNLAQGLAIWNTARVHLKWLALSPLEGAFKSIAHLVPWDLSLAPPRLMELIPVARRADEIGAAICGSVGLAALEPRSLESVWKRVKTVSKVRMVEREIRHHQEAAFIQSSSWLLLWKVSERDRRAAEGERLANGAGRWQLAACLVPSAGALEPEPARTWSFGNGRRSRGEDGCRFSRRRPCRRRSPRP
jgi:hypothetical protein